MFHTNTEHSFDKYQAFRELECPITKSSDWEDDFGDFQSHLEANNHNSHSLLINSLLVSECCKITTKVLVCCKQIIHKVFNLLVVNHDELKVIEALCSEKGRNFILGKPLRYF